MVRILRARDDKPPSEFFQMPKLMFDHLELLSIDGKLGFSR